jgi:HemY protein
MVRGLIFFLKLAVLVTAAVWIAEQPGQVLIEWQGYRIETSVGILILAVLLVAVVAAVLYRFWGRFIRLPGSVAGWTKGRRRRRGYEALTQGMVSVAAGEPDEARRFARKADHLLEEPPLTMLLSAQAAQLNGDEQAATRYFNAMLENPETRFLGLRGLLRQAERDGNWRAALDYAKQAYDLRPRTPWVLSSLFELSLRAGDPDRALEATADSRRQGVLTREEADRRRGLLLTEKARRALADGDEITARDTSKQAHKLVPELPAAAQVRARVLLAEDRKRAAAKTIEETWARHPHPDLIELYRQARPAKDALDRVTKLNRLAERNPGHRESEIALARAALDAGLWGEARRHLEKADGESPGETVCRMMAELEERENGDQDAARQWLIRATDAPGDPAWVCGHCGVVAADWHAVCGHCGSFDSFTWRTPPQITEAEAEYLAGPAQHARLEGEAAKPAAAAAAAAASGQAAAVEDAETTEAPAGEAATSEVRPETDSAQAERQPS